MSPSNTPRRWGSPLSDVNTIFAILKAGKVEGRVVLDLSQLAKTQTETGESAHA